MAKGASEMLKEMNPRLKFALHLDHGNTFELCKSCIDSDGRLAMTASIRKVLSDKPGEFDPRKYLGRQVKRDLWLNASGLPNFIKIKAPL